MKIKGEEHYHKLVFKDKVRRTKDNNKRVRNEYCIIKNYARICGGDKE